MYIHIYIYTYIHIYIFTYLHIYIYTYIHIYIQVYTCIYMYIHVYTYIHIYIYTYIHIHIYTYIHTGIYMYIHVYTYIHVYLCTYIHTYMHTYIHTYIHTYVRTYIRTYIHTYLHTYVRTYIHTYAYICIHINGGFNTTQDSSLVGGVPVLFSFSRPQGNLGSWNPAWSTQICLDSYGNHGPPVVQWWLGWAYSAYSLSHSPSPQASSVPRLQVEKRLTIMPGPQDGWDTSQKMIWKAKRLSWRNDRQKCWAFHSSWITGDIDESIGGCPIKAAW